MSRTRYTLAFDRHNMVKAPDATADPSIIWTSENGIMLVYGTTVPTTANTYCPGCLFIKVNATSDDTLYVNNGTYASPSFTTVYTTNTIIEAIQADDLAGTAAGAGPSPLIWDDAELLNIMLDPTQGFYYFNDYLGEIDITDNDGYALDTTTTGGITPVADEDGGVLLVDSQGNASADDGVNVQLPNCTFKAVAGRTIYFEARVKMKDTGDDQYFIGLCAPATAAIMTAGVMDDTVDKVGFHREQGSTADKITSITARTSAEDETVDVADIADGAYVKLGFVIDGLTSVTFYVNGVVVETGVTTANIPNAVVCLSYVAQVEQTSADAELHIDWVRILQVGTRS